MQNLDSAERWPEVETQQTNAKSDSIKLLRNNVATKGVSSQREEVQAESSTGNAQEEALDTNLEKKDRGRGNVADLSLLPGGIEQSPDAKAVVSLVAPCLEPNNQGSETGIRERSFSLVRPKPLDTKLFPDQPRTGLSQLPSTVANVEHLLNKYHITVRYDVIKKKVRINLPGHTGTIDNQDNVTMTHILSLATLNGLSTGQIPAYIEALADRNMFNPVADWILSKPWDGKERLRDICETITERDGFPPTLKIVLVQMAAQCCSGCTQAQRL